MRSEERLNSERLRSYEYRSLVSLPSSSGNLISISSSALVIDLMQPCLFATYFRDATLTVANRLLHRGTHTIQVGDRVFEHHSLSPVHERNREMQHHRPSQKG